MTADLRVAVVSPWPLDDPAAWSGVVLPMVTALRDRCQVVEVSTRDVPDALVDRVACRLLDRRRGRRYLVGHAVATARRRGAALGRRLETIAPDAVLAIAASQDTAFLPGPWPVVQVSDTTLAAIIDYYPLYAHLDPWLGRQARQVSARSAARVAHTLAASDWARDALVRDDGIAPDAVTVAPFGPGIRGTAAVPVRSWPGPLRVLAVVSDWHRKGGDRVLATYRELQARGVEIALTVVGATPALPAGITGPGRVTRDELAALYASHDVLLEPARSNAAGVTLTDAAWFGLPALATATGGVATIVADGETGVLVPDDASLVARLADELSVGTQVWRARGDRAAERARSVLSWQSWGMAALSVLSRVASTRAAGPQPGQQPGQPAGQPAGTEPGTQPERDEP